MNLIVVLSDFGWKDGYAGILKGVIWNIAPGVPVTDLTHEISPQDIFQGALTLGRAAPYFPAGSIFLAVVDPGVGTSRRPMAARFGNQYFVGPDNGLFTLLLEEGERRGQGLEMYHLTRPQYWLQKISNVFHGRDIFAPVAAHLALDVPLSMMGERMSDPVRLNIPVPQRKETGWGGEVIHIDSFGNLATNLRSEHLQGRGQIELRIGEITIRGMVRSFAEGVPGQFVALIDSSGALSICQVNTSAERSLGAALGMVVEIAFVT